MGWNNSYPYAGRQPPAARVSIRKAVYGSNTGARTRAFERMALGRFHAPVDGKDYLIHADGAVTVVQNMPEDTLEHFGILGMKWGVRRYQNEDGTLTEEGKKRYGTDKIPESETWKKQDAERLSDEELNRRNSRLQREQNYKNLMTSESERERNQLKKEIIKKVIIAGLITGAAAAMRGQYKKVGQFISGFAKKKVAPLKAASIIKSILKKTNVPHSGQYNPLKDYALGRHPEWAGIDWNRRVGQ